MNTNAPTFPASPKRFARGGAARSAATRARPLATWFVADWRHMVFAHYRVPAETLAPHVPHPLDLRDGCAWVSLVFFTLENMRPPGTGALGRALLRPVSDHAFLNVRTYVRTAAGPGIHFLAEWVPNRLAVWLGPRTYGLPYRLGRFECDLAGANGGVGRVAVRDAALGAKLALAFPTQPAPLAPAAPGTPAEFLLERYTASTARGGTLRRFEVAHEPYEFHTAGWFRADTTLVARAFPWFAAAEFDCAHLSPGVRDVRMSQPYRLAESEKL